MKKVYMIGIKGVGMTPLAIIAKQAGFDVKGSDVDEKFTTDKSLDENGIRSDIGFSKDYLEEFFKDTDTKNSYVIYSASHEGANNPQVKYAQEKNIPTIPQGEAIGKIMDGSLFGKKRIGISVAGTHGKTTTSALIAFLLTKLGADPGYLIGSSEIFPLGEPGYFGEGKYFVAEADEYIGDKVSSPEPKFLAHNPTYVLVTNIDFDHPDVFQDIKDVKIAFKKLLSNIPPSGLAVINIDDTNSLEVVADANCKYITYGKSKEADYVYSNITESVSGQKFTLSVKDKTYTCEISLSGVHNVANATSAIALLSVIGFEVDKILKILPQFKGTKRRNEVIGESKDGALIIDDYAHHPREITTTLKGLKNKYNKKIVVIFQPHTYSRTEALLDDFANSFSDADEVILLPIFASAREKDHNTNTEEKIRLEIKDKVKNTTVLSSLESVVEYLDQKKFDSNYIMVTMGAGDVYKIAEELKNK